MEDWERKIKGSSFFAEKKNKENEDWAKYITCDMKHDAFKEYDINTFITEYREFKKCKTEKEIQFDLMKKIQDAETVTFEFFIKFSIREKIALQRPSRYLYESPC